MLKTHGANLILIFIFAGAIPALAKAPAWFSENVLKKDGQTLDVSCSGVGPDKAVANQVSISQCQGIGLQYVEGYTVKTRSLSIEDSQQAAWHSESTTDANVTGLDCKPLRQDCQESDSAWTCYLLCRFDLKTARLMPVTDNKTTDEHESSLQIRGAADVGSVPMPKGTTTKEPLIQSTSRQIIFSSIPACDSILVIGESRVIKCAGVQSIVLYPADRELIVRAKGYKPRHIRLQSPENRKPTGYEPTEQVEVYLEKL